MSKAAKLHSLVCCCGVCVLARMTSDERARNYRGLRRNHRAGTYGVNSRQTRWAVRRPGKTEQSASGSRSLSLLAKTGDSPDPGSEPAPKAL
jgi:hypothetical protein